MERMVYIGLDVHAETIAVATADDGRNSTCGFTALSKTTLMQFYA
ncbi:hypothetical protein LJR235_005168 [Pararhizobium sp. LjRoot235]